MRKQIHALRPIVWSNWAEDKIRIRLPLLLSLIVDEFIGHFDAVRSTCISRADQQDN